MKGLYSTGKDPITIPSVHLPGTVVDTLAFSGVSTSSVEIIPQFWRLLPCNAFGSHGVGNGLIFESIVSGYFGRIRMDLLLFRTGFSTNTSKFLIINLNGTSESMAQHIKAGVEHPSDKLLNFEGKKGSFILIIDDEPDICKLLQVSLVKHGYSVKYVHALTEGMQYLQQQQPDLLFLDIHLPDGSGLEALPAIRKKCPALPVITISAYDNGMEKQKALNAGASYFMAKPFTVTNLDELMSNMLSQK